MSDAEEKWGSSVAVPRIEGRIEERLELLETRWRTGGGKNGSEGEREARGLWWGRLWNEAR